MVLNYIWVAFFVIAFAVALGKSIATGDLSIWSTIMDSSFSSAATAFDRISRPTINGATTTTYSYCYHNPDSVFASDIYVEVDEKGHTKRIYTTK